MTIMENLQLAKTEYTPKIIMDAANRLIELHGDSFPENTYDFYRPVIKWMEEYFSQENKEKTVINMEINYFNSSSSQLFFDFFDIVENAVSNGLEVEVNWYYVEKNESALEAGEDFDEEFESITFNLIEK